MRILLFAIMLFSGGCTSAPHLEPADGPRDQTIYLVSHGWHTGIVIRADDIPPEVWPVAADFPQATYIEVGWGDREYYMASDPDPGAGTAARAAVVGGPGVLHIVGLRDTPQREFPASEVVALPVSRQGLNRLGRHIAASYERNTDGRPIALGPGLYGNSRFYASRERFHLFHTCNVWTAKALRTAGLPIAGALTADGVMEQARAASKALTSGPKNRER